MDTRKAFNNTQQNVNYKQNDGIYLNIINVNYDKPTTNIMNGKTVKSFSLTREGYPFSLLLIQQFYF